jgi:hypothetical protein
MSTARVLPWRPKTPPPVAPIEELWAVTKWDCRIKCVLEQGGRLGWIVRVEFNGHWSFRCEFTTWQAAVDAADSKFRELFAEGWRLARA